MKEFFYPVFLGSGITDDTLAISVQIPEFTDWGLIQTVSLLIRANMKRGICYEKNHPHVCLYLFIA